MSELDPSPLAERAPRSARRPRTWNVMATAYEGQRDALRMRLKPLGAFRGSGYRNILLGSVPDVPAFLDGVRDALVADRVLAGALGKIVPIDVVVPFELETVVDTLTATAADAFLDRLATGSFFVRLERRGLRHHLHSSNVERAIGERLVAALEARGAAPVVRFKDSDWIVAIETVGEEAGLALLSRERRTAYPFIRVK